MVVRSFAFDRDLTERFIRFGSEIYRGDRDCFPTFASDTRYMLSDHFPFFQHHGNRHRHFLAISGERVAGRVTAMVNRELRDRDGTPVGTVGLFECEPDYAVARVLLDAAIGWLGETKGIRRIWGPMNFDIWHGYRFKTGGYDRKQFFGEPYNKRYYPEYFVRFGFVPRQRWESVEVPSPEQMAASALVGAQRRRRLVSEGYRFTSFNTGAFRSGVRTLHRLIGASYSGFLGFTPISLAEFERHFRRAIPAMDPELLTFSYDPHGEAVGFVGGYIEVSDALRATGGRGGVLSRIRFAVNRRRAKRVVLYIIGITPEVSGRGLGLGSALYSSFIHRALERGYSTLIAALMSSGNRSRTLLGDTADPARREYTLYEVNL